MLILLVMMSMVMVMIITMMTLPLMTAVMMMMMMMTMMVMMTHSEPCWKMTFIVTLMASSFIPKSVVGSRNRPTQRGETQNQLCVT